MSKDETTQPAQRWNIGDAKSTNPPWTGLYFTCEHCGAQYQLGCADECDPCMPKAAWTAIGGETEGAVSLWLAPECWTCGHRNVIKTPRFDQEANPS